jgi:hypothetical protein
MLKWVQESRLGAPPANCLLDFTFATCYANAGIAAQQVPECQSLDAAPRGQCLAYYTDLIASQRCACPGMTTPVKPASWGSPTIVPGQFPNATPPKTPETPPAKSNTALWVIGGVAVLVGAVVIARMV